MVTMELTEQEAAYIRQLRMSVTERHVEAQALAAQQIAEQRADMPPEAVAELDAIEAMPADQREVYLLLKQQDAIAAELARPERLPAVHAAMAVIQASGEVDAEPVVKELHD